MKKIRAILSLILAVVMLLAMGAMSVSATEETPAEVDLDGVYHATLGIQTNPTLWQCRMGYYVGNHDATFGTEYWNQLCSGTFGGEDFVAYAGTFDEIEIAGNGTYTVSLKGADFGGETSVTQLHVATDIPNTGAITFSDVVVKADGRKVGQYDEGYLDKDAYADNLCVLLAYNNWRNDLKAMGAMDTEILPAEEITITFTVSGFNYDSPELIAQKEAEEKAKAEAEAQAQAEAEALAQAEAEAAAKEAGCTGGVALLPIASVIVAAALVIFKKRA